MSSTGFNLDDIYKPLKGPSIAFAVLFLISGILHLWQNNIKYKSWRIGFLLPWAAALFVSGFIVREYACYHPTNLGVFIAFNVLLYIAPPVYNGANYFVFGRALYYLPYLSPIHPGRVWSTFIALDLFTDIIAGQGISRATNISLGPKERNAGFILVKVSLFLLLGMFIAFFYLIIVFHIRAQRSGKFTSNIKTIVYTLYASNLLILLRNTFRLAAFFYPIESTANGKEWPFWVFECVPMLVNTYLLNVLPPAKYLPANHKIYLALDGKTELEGPGMVDKRHFILTVVDPFDIHGLITGRDSRNRYWLTDGIGGVGAEGSTDRVEVQPKA